MGETQLNNAIRIEAIQRVTSAFRLMGETQLSKRFNDYTDAELLSPVPFG